MSTIFDQYAAKGNEVLHLIMEDLRVPSDKAARILRSVIQALRNQLSLEESMQLLAQLPMAIKALYVDQWNPRTQPIRIRHVDQFLSEVRQLDPLTAGYDFGNDESAQKAVTAVFKALGYYVSEGEWNDIKAMLPEDLKKLISESLGTEKPAL